MDRAFERLYRRHALDVYRYAYAVLRNRADAEDVAQTTFMNAYRALERGETPQSPHNWLIAIAHNVCRQRFRQASRRVQEVGLDDDVADAFVAEDDERAPSPEDIRRALGHLAFNQRAALVMRELEGRSYAEIAGVLGLTVSAVETLLFRARRALREQLEASFTCVQAEQAISRQLDGRLSRAERSQLRAHLRECEECRRCARSQRAQRSALKAFGAVPLPQSLATLFGGGGAALATKAAAVVVTAGVAGGIGWDVHHAPAPPAPAPAVPRATVHRPPARPPVLGVAPAVSTALLPVRRDARPQRARARAVHASASRPAARVVLPLHVHPQHPVRPLHPAGPLHPAQPPHPAHPTHPQHPVTPAATTTAARHPAHPAHPARPAPPQATGRQQQPASGNPHGAPPGQGDPGLGEPGQGDPGQGHGKP
ncbi:MAG TPA: sigma-70 family RNA polymerase sigma factor [Gaiellaceae bacterium]|nr:sigma-70 family RNA polymerase sigma factor [Gaiellaceae bacterium]